MGTDYSDPASPDVTNVSYDADGQPAHGHDRRHRHHQLELGQPAPDDQQHHRRRPSRRYHYDLAGRLTAIDYAGGTGTVTRGYDDADRLTSVTDWNAHRTTFGYDPDSELTSQTYPNGTTATSSYDRTGQAAGIQHAPTANLGAPFASFGYGRDGAGLLSS